MGPCGPGCPGGPVGPGDPLGPWERRTIEARSWIDMEIALKNVYINITSRTHTHTHNVQVILMFQGTLCLLSGEQSQSHHRGHPGGNKTEINGLVEPSCCVSSHFFDKHIQTYDKIIKPHKIQPTFIPGSPGMP